VWSGGTRQSITTSTKVTGVQSFTHKNTKYIDKILKDYFERTF